MRLIAKVLPGLVGALLLAGVSWILGLGDMLMNEVRLGRLERSFAALQDPAGTERIRLESRVGLLSGNGNHCDYFVGELRVTAKPLAEVLAAYVGATVREPMRGEASEVYVGEVKGQEIDDLPMPYELSSVVSWTRGATIPEGSRLYLVGFFANEEANGDLRCH
ncbi:MAG: hypothetical protein QM765_31420 [Myxococcales bacterium]